MSFCVTSWLILNLFSLVVFIAFIDGQVLLFGGFFGKCVALLILGMAGVAFDPTEFYRMGPTGD